MLTRFLLDVRFLNVGWCRLRDEVEKRVFANAQEYKTNYLIVVVGVFLFALFTSPLLLFVVLSCIGLWYGCRSRTSNALTSNAFVSSKHHLLFSS